MINIYLLKDKQEYINKIANINFNTWIDFYQDNAFEDITSVDEYVEYLKENCLNYDKLLFPIQLVAINKLDNNTEEYVGSVSLIDDDFPEISRDRIWITELYVDKKYRNNGNAKLLIKSALNFCKNINLKEVYLSCLKDLINYYTKLNFINTGEKIFFTNKTYYIYKYLL